MLRFWSFCVLHHRGTNFISMNFYLRSPLTQLQYSERSRRGHWFLFGEGKIVAPFADWIDNTELNIGLRQGAGTAVIFRNVYGAATWTLLQLNGQMERRKIGLGEPLQQLSPGNMTSLTVITTKWSRWVQCLEFKNVPVKVTWLSFDVNLDWVLLLDPLANLSNVSAVCLWKCVNRRPHCLLLILCLSLTSQFQWSAHFILDMAGNSLYGALRFHTMTYFLQNTFFLA